MTCGRARLIRRKIVHFEYETLKLYTKYLKTINQIFRQLQTKCKGRDRKTVDNFEKVFIKVLVELYKAKFDFNNSDQIQSRAANSRRTEQEPRVPLRRRPTCT